MEFSPCSLLIGYCSPFSTKKVLLCFIHVLIFSVLVGFIKHSIIVLRLHMSLSLLLQANFKKAFFFFKWQMNHFIVNDIKENRCTWLFKNICKPFSCTDRFLQDLPLGFKLAVSTLMWEKNWGKLNLDNISVNQLSAFERGLDDLKYRAPGQMNNDPIGLGSVGQYVHNGQKMLTCPLAGFNFASEEC